MNSTVCPQCKKELNESTKRLIQDTCGHKKCRSCLLQEDSGCKICLENTIPNVEPTKCNISVIKYDRKSEILNTQKCIKGEEKLIEESKEYASKAENNDSPLQTTENFEIHKSIPHIIILSKTPLLYKCNVCSKSFSTSNSVKYHSYCGGTEKPLKCETCQKSFVNRSHLEAHKMKHTDLRPFSCVHCHKSFLQKSKLNRHLKLHTGERPFVCTTCGKTFTNRDALNGHIRIHNGDKPFSCKYCGSRCNNKSNLRKHMATHSKEKSYMCEECGKKFGNKFSLVSHRKCHTFDRPHTCQKCSKSFTNIKDLRRHTLIHLDVKPYGCSICNMTFCRKDNLERHLKNTHSMKDAKAIKSASIRKTINKKNIDSITSTKNNTETETLLPLPDSEENEIFKEKPNAIHVIKMNDSQLPVLNPVDTRPSIKNAVPVINGPFKLAFKTDAFKNNYNILNRDYTSEPPPRIQTKKHDMVESLNICQKIFNPNSDPPVKCENPIDCINVKAPINTTKNVIMSVGKVNEKDSLEICKKIFAPNDATPIHYETSFEEKKHGDIKNIKFKLPSTYTNNAYKNNSQVNEFENNSNYTELKSVFNNYEINNGQNKIKLNIKNENKNYTELKPIFSNEIKKSVIVNPLSSEFNQRESFSDIHWRRRTSQNFQPKTNML